jgi:aminoglycoside phosphotransferase (APT) family kinase protein
LLDWEMVRLGDPVQDLAWWIGSDRCFSEGLGAPRLQGLPDRAPTVARWEQLTGRRAEHLDYYEVLALTRFSVTMARIGLQMKHYEVLPPESDFDVVNLASLTLERQLAELA